MMFAQVDFWDLAWVLLYLAAVGYLGWLGYSHTKNATDYLVAGRKVHPFIMAMSYGATFISTSAIVGFGGVAGLFGMSLLWLTFFNIFAGIFVAFIVLGGPTRRMGHRLDAHTFPELMGRRFESRFIQVLAGLIIFCVMPLYAAAVLIGGTEFMATAFGLDYNTALFVFAVVTGVYVFFGGLKGVLYTDTFQGVIMTVGMLILLIWAYVSVGGVVTGHTELTAMKDQAFVGFKKIGHQGWTSMPQFGWGKPDYNLWWIVVSTLVMGVGIGVLAQPQLVLRFLTVKSGRELNRALVYGGTFILLMTGVAFTVGALSNIYFFKREKVVGRILSREEAKVIAKKEPGQKPATVPCVLLHVDTTGSGKADTHLVERGIDTAGPDGKTIPWSKLMPQAQITPLPDGRAEILPRASSFTRAVVPAGPDWVFNPDSIIPTYITAAMPRWFKVVFLLTLLAAAMSTMSSQCHTLGSAIGHDVFEQLSGREKPGQPPPQATGDKRTIPVEFANSGRSDSAAQKSNRTIVIVRAGIVVGLLLAVTFAYFTRGGYIIARATAIFFGLCASAFLPAFVGGLFFRRITKAGAISSMAVGLLVTGFWLVFVKEAEAGAIGLVRLVTGGPNSILANYPNWPVVDPLFVALPLSALTALVVSLFTRPPADTHLAKCFGAGSS